MNNSINLEKLNKDDFHFEKTLHFNKQIVFKAFTQAKHFQKWWGPINSEITNCNIDLSVGGKLSLDMNTSKGTRQFAGEFYEIHENEKLIFSLKVLEKEQSFFETLNTVEFIEPEPGQTILTINIKVLNADPEKAIFALKGTKEGWSEGLEKLSIFLSKNII